MQEKREIQEINFENDYLLLKFGGRLLKLHLKRFQRNFRKQV